MFQSFTAPLQWLWRSIFFLHAKHFFPSIAQSSEVPWRVQVTLCYSYDRTKLWGFFFTLSFCLFKRERNCIFLFWPIYRPACLLRYFSPRWDTFSFKVLKETNSNKTCYRSCNCFLSLFYWRKICHNQCLHYCHMSIYMTWPLNNFLFKWLIPLQFHFQFSYQN